MNKFLVFLLFYLLWEVILSFPSVINATHNKLGKKLGIDWLTRRELRPLTFTFIYYCLPFIVMFILGQLLFPGSSRPRGVNYMNYRSGKEKKTNLIAEYYKLTPNFAIGLSFAVWMFLCERIAYWFLEYKLEKRKLKESINLEFVELQANNHDANAQKELGLYYMQMHYVNMKSLFNFEDENNSEYSKAIAWLEKAATHGDEEAIRIVSLKDRLYDEITLDESLEDTMNRLEGKDNIDTTDKIEQRLPEWRESGLRQYICIRCTSVLLYLIVVLLISTIFGVSPFN